MDDAREPPWLEGSAFLGATRLEAKDSLSLSCSSPLFRGSSSVSSRSDFLCSPFLSGVVIAPETLPLAVDPDPEDSGSTGIDSERFLFLNPLRVSVEIAAHSCVRTNDCDEGWISVRICLTICESSAAGAGISETFNLVKATGLYERS